MKIKHLLIAGVVLLGGYYGYIYITYGGEISTPNTKVAKPIIPKSVNIKAPSTTNKPTAQKVSKQDLLNITDDRVLEQVKTNNKQEYAIEFVRNDDGNSIEFIFRNKDGREVPVDSDMRTGEDLEGRAWNNGDDIRQLYNVGDHIGYLTKGKQCNLLFWYKNDIYKTSNLMSEGFGIEPDPDNSIIKFTVKYASNSVRQTINKEYNYNKDKMKKWYAYQKAKHDVYGTNDMKSEVY